MNAPFDVEDLERLSRPPGARNDPGLTIADDGSTFLFGDFSEENPAHTENPSRTRDSGNLPNHRQDRQSRQDRQAPDLSEAIASIESALILSEDDPGVLASADFNATAAMIREYDPEAWFRLRGRIKAAARAAGVPLGEIDKATRPPGDDFDDTGIADDLVALARSQAELFHAEDGICFARLKARPRAIYRLDTQAFAEWIGYAYYRDTEGEHGTGRAASDTAIRTARVVLTGIAKNDGEERKVYLRAARHDETYYLDLGDPTWRAVEITAAGWRIVDDPPVCFWRSGTLRPLPDPTPGALDLLWAYANIPAAARPLVLAWMMEAWRPETPFPVLELIGQQGTAKSSTQSCIRDCVDPNAVNLRAAPKSVEDLFVSAGSNWLTSLNNLSHLTANMQDALCSLATGGGFAARTLYTNADETLIDAKRPVAINGINPLVTAQDLADRVVHVELSEIETYQSETAIRANFERDRPAIFGALLDLFVATLARLPRVTIARPPRMADFAALGEAMMTAQGKPPGAFMRLYQANRRDSVARGLEASPVAQALRDYAEAQAPRYGRAFHGNWKMLLRELEPYRDSSEAWPKSTQGLAGIIRRQRPALAQVGVTVTIGGHTERGTEVSIHRVKADDLVKTDDPDELSESFAHDGYVKRPECVSMVEGEL